MGEDCAAVGTHANPRTPLAMRGEQGSDNGNTLIQISHKLILKFSTRSYASSTHDLLGFPTEIEERSESLINSRRSHPISTDMNAL